MKKGESIMQKEDFLMKSPTRGELNLQEIVGVVRDYIEESPHDNYQITIGTDSQNFDRTKIVEVIAVHRSGKGGIFFYKISYLKRITNIRQKLTQETQMSLELADAFLEEMENEFFRSGFVYDEPNITYTIHVDAGNDGKTNVLVPEIVAWVKANGYNVSIKPYSYAASSIANKFSK